MVGPGGNVGDAFFFNGGTFIGTDDGEVAETVAPDGGCDEPNPNLGCFSFGPSFWDKIGSFFSNFWAGLGNIFGGSGGSGGGGNTTILNWGGAFSGIYPAYNYDPNSSGGGSGPTKISDYFDVTLLQGIERKNAIEINKFKDKYCLYTPAAEILNQLTAKCDLSDDPNELFGQIKENLYALIENLPECVKEVIMEDRFNSLSSQYGLSLTASEFADAIGAECFSSSNCIDDCMIEEALSADFAKNFSNDPNWINDVITEIPYNAAGPVVDANHPICGAIFNCRPLQSDAQYIAGGISNLKIALNVNGANKEYLIEKLYFTCTASEISQIGVPLSSLLAQTINNAIITTQTRISSGNLVPVNGESDQTVLERCTFLFELRSQFSAVIRSYSGSPFAVTCQYAHIDIPYLRDTEGVDFVNFETDFASKCN
jgi:hypothetical protein